MTLGEYKTYTSCRICNSSTLELLIDYGLMPLAGGFMTLEEIAIRNVVYPLRVAYCNDCMLIQVLDVVAPETIFSQYSYATSTTQTLLEHYSKMGGELVDTFSAKDKLVVEFGCNDGVLIKSLYRAGAFAIGVDPSDVANKASLREGWPLINNYFTQEVATTILAEHGQANIIVGNNVFAHVNDLHTILRGVIELLDDNGVFIIEVCYQGKLINKIQFDTVYHEHICYFSLTSLHKLFSQYDLKLIDVQELPTHSGSIRVTAAKIHSPYEQTLGVNKMLEDEKKLDVKQFVNRVHHHRDVFRDFIVNLKKTGKHIGAYGAAGRMTILLNFCGLNHDLIDYAVDISPLRYGRIVPGVLIPIVPPEVFHANPLDYMIMTAWSYESEILKKEKSYLKSGGKFIIPLPNIRIIS